MSQEQQEKKIKRAKVEPGWKVFRHQLSQLIYEVVPIFPWEMADMIVKYALVPIFYPIDRQPILHRIPQELHPQNIILSEVGRAKWMLFLDDSRRLHFYDEKGSKWSRNFPYPPPDRFHVDEEEKQMSIRTSMYYLLFRSMETGLEIPFKKGLTRSHVENHARTGFYYKPDDGRPITFYSSHADIIAETDFRTGSGFLPLNSEFWASSNAVVCWKGPRMPSLFVVHPNESQDCYFNLEIPSFIRTPVCDLFDNRFVAWRTDGFIVCIDTSSGKELWRICHNLVFCLRFLSRSVVCVTSNDECYLRLRVEAYDTETGQLLDTLSGLATRSIFGDQPFARLASSADDQWIEVRGLVDFDMIE